MRELFEVQQRIEKLLKDHNGGLSISTSSTKGGMQIVDDLFYKAHSLLPLIGKSSGDELEYILRVIREGILYYRGTSPMFITGYCNFLVGVKNTRLENSSLTKDDESLLDQEINHLKGKLDDFAP